jgi:hypothetical protein
MMRTESFQSILNGVAKRLGMVPSRDLTPSTAEKLTEYVNDRLKEGWKFDFWPEWTVAEKRYLRETYSAANSRGRGGREIFYRRAGLLPGVAGASAGDASAGDFDGRGVCGEFGVVGPVRECV